MSDPFASAAFTISGDNGNAKSGTRLVAEFAEWALSKQVDSWTVTVKGRAHVDMFLLEHGPRPLTVELIIGGHTKGVYILEGDLANIAPLIFRGTTPLGVTE